MTIAIARMRPGHLATTLLLLAGALPLLVSRPAPLQDWPNHVARVHVLAALLRCDAFWGRFYRLSGFLVPDAALDLGILGLSRLGLPVEIAAQSFLVAAYLVFIAGFCMLASALDAYGPVKPGFAVLLFYCNALFWGLVNYVLGCGLLLGLLALWLRAARHPGRRFAIASLGALLLLFTHVVAAAAWIVVLSCFDLRRFVSSRRPLPRRLAGSASWLLALLIAGGLLHAMPEGAGHDFRMVYPGAGAGGGISGMVARKLGILARVLLGGSAAQDAASLAALLVCALLAALARPRLAAAPGLAVAALVVVTLAAPERLGTGSVLDTRLAILPLLLLAAAVRITAPHPATGMIAVAVLARTLVLGWNWHAAGLVFGAFRQDSAGLPRGSVMMAAYATRLHSLSQLQIWSPAITSIATQVAFRDVFVPALFANPAQQPIALRARFQPLAQPWNLADATHLRASAQALAAICKQGRFAGVYLTVLYPGALQPGPALLHAHPDFLILDGCRLPG